MRETLKVPLLALYNITVPSEPAKRIEEPFEEAANTEFSGTTLL